MRRDILRKCIASVTLSLLLFFGNGMSAFAAKAPREVLKTAAEGLPRYLDAVKDDKFHFREWGLFDREGNPIGKIKLGEPWQVYSIDKKEFFKYDGKGSILEMIHPTDDCEFPVLSDGQPRAILKVQFMGNLRKAIGLGSGGAKAEVADSLRKKWNSAKDFQLDYVHAAYAFVSFFVVTHNGETKIVPLSERDFGSRSGQECNLQDIYPTLKKLLKERRGGGLL
jgi:hypothetical protein